MGQTQNSVPNGNECGCVCPHCKCALCAKNGGDGERMVHHFAHLSGADCVGAVESALHKMAKDVLSETKCVLLPKRQDGRKAELLHFDRVETESYDKETKLRPDSIGYYNGTCLWIEFKRTHAVDTKKRGKIISAHIDCIEIDLNGCSLDPLAVKDFIVNSSESRIWIRDISKPNRQAGHAGDSTYCDRYDDYDKDFRHVVRRFAKDEEGRLVNLQDDNANMNEHTYYCLACGKELTIDVDVDGTYCFKHIDNDVRCDDDFYLHEAAKEVIYNRFIHSDEFEISIPQYKLCNENRTCQFCNEEECVKEEKVRYDIKKHGYVECLKDYRLPDTAFKCDVVIKRKDSLEDAIIISIDAGSCHVDATSLSNRIIELGIDDDWSLDSLQNEPIGDGSSAFVNFKRKNSQVVYRSDIQRGIEKFELFSSGKYHLDKYSCSEISNRKRSTVYEIVFVGEMVDFGDAKLYSLLRCYRQKKKACYCELCFFLAEISSYWMAEKICKRYKTKGTPQYPLSTMPMECQYFSLNRALVSKIDGEYKDIKIVERDYIPKSVSDKQN